MTKGIGYFCNGLGNFMMMMPALQAVASLTDSKKIDLCINNEWRDSRRPAVEEICEKWDVIDQILHYPKDNIDPRKYDLWFYSPHGVSCDVTILFKDRLNHLPVAKPSWRESLMYERDHYMEIAYALGYVGEIPKVKFPLAEKPILRSENTNSVFIGFCNGAFATPEWEKKRWPHFKRLVEIVKRYFDVITVGVGNVGELKGIKFDYDFTGSLSITETAKVISQCDLMVTTDTANMHLSWLLDKPLIALFGPTLTSKNAPRYDKTTILISGYDCAPCQDTIKFRNCRNDENDCMASISVGDVMAVIKDKYYPLIMKSRGKEYGTHII